MAGNCNNILLKYKTNKSELISQCQWGILDIAIDLSSQQGQTVNVYILQIQKIKDKYNKREK